MLFHLRSLGPDKKGHAAVVTLSILRKERRMQYGAVPTNQSAQALTKVKDGLAQLKATIATDPTLTDDQKATYVKHIDSLMSLG